MRHAISAQDKLLSKGNASLSGNLGHQFWDLLVKPRWREVSSNLYNALLADCPFI